jgi:hypothetical protein
MYIGGICRLFLNRKKIPNLNNKHFSLVYKLKCPNIPTLNGKGGRRGHDRDRMVVGFITTCAFSAYHH